ncbi:MAG: DUF1853 family protein [Halieaceae bacterium]
MPKQIYIHSCVRDLAWAGFSPLLIKTHRMSGAGLPWTAYWAQKLKELDQDPAPLLEHLDKAQSNRLGIYYESLWHYLLQEDPDTELLAHNLPIRDESQTIGEFDCLFYCLRRKIHVHLELAVKFYLGVASDNIWLGPGRQDRLDLKLERLLQHQSQLGQHPAAREPLLALGIQSYESRIDLKGYLFSPGEGMSTPQGYNPENPLQHWHSIDQFLALPPLPQDWIGWQKIPRKRWLSPFLANEGKPEHWDSLSAALEQRFVSGKRPVQVAACDDAGVEQYRCFVTGPNWPADNAAPSGD